MPRYRQALLDADCCSAPTDFLAARCRALGREAFVVRNGALAEPGPDAAPAVGGGVRFGYLSGSLTHQRDFAILSIPLARVMAARAEVTLRLVGDLEFSEFPELLRFLARVEHRPAVAWEGLAREWREIDVNLVPLEIGNPYCEAKSEIKFVEAAAQGVPTIASPTAPLAAAIRDGETGLLAATPAEWEAAMQRLAADPALRRRLGRAAREEVVARYGAAAVGAEARWACATLLSAQRAQRGWAETALALSVVVAPCDGDVPPGTRHLLDVVRALAEMGHEVRLFVAGEPAAVERSKHALWRDGYLGALRFAGSAAAMAACDVMVALDAVAARAAEPLAGLAMRAFAAGDASPAGEGPALLPERVLGADPAVAARALAELLQRQLEGDAAETAARRHV